MFFPGWWVGWVGIAEVKRRDLAPTSWEMKESRMQNAPGASLRHNFPLVARDGSCNSQSVRHPAWEALAACGGSVCRTNPGRRSRHGRRGGGRRLSGGRRVCHRCFSPPPPPRCKRCSHRRGCGRLPHCTCRCHRCPAAAAHASSAAAAAAANSAAAPFAPVPTCRPRPSCSCCNCPACRCRPPALR